MSEFAEPGSGVGLGRPAAGNRHHLLDETHRLSETDLEPAAYFQELLPRLLHGAGARGGIIWSYGIDTGHRLDAHAGHVDDVSAPAQQALLNYVAQQRKPLLLPPGGSTSDGSATNPTASVLVLVPVLVEQAVVGIHQLHWDPAAASSLGEVLPFLVGMAHYASIHHRNGRLREMNRQHAMWLRLEEFGRQLHTLDFDRVAYVLANEGRHLVGGDRLSVLEKRGWRMQIAAVSGADVVAPRSRQMVLLAQLGQAVLAWGETLDFLGVPDDSLPAPVVAALDAYLEITACSRLILLPLRDAEETGDARFVLALESFEPSAETDSALDRLRLVGRHAVSALANAAAHRAVPFRRVWAALSTCTEARGRAILSIGCVAASLIALLLAAMYLDYPLHLQADGRLLPCIRRSLYSPVEAQVVRFEPGVRSSASIVAGQPLVLMYDLQLELKQIHLEHEIAGLQEEALMLAAQQTAARGESDRASYAADKKQKEMLRDQKLAELRILAERTHADESRPGHFWLTAPLTGTVFSIDFHEKQTGGWYARPKRPHRRSQWWLGGCTCAARGRPDPEAFARDMGSGCGPGLASRPRVFAAAGPETGCEAVADQTATEYGPRMVASTRDIPERIACRRHCC